MKNNKIKLNKELTKENRIELDCGHKSNTWIKVNGKTMCYVCYKKSKHRKSKLKKYYENDD